MSKLSEWLARNLSVCLNCSGSAKNTLHLAYYTPQQWLMANSQKTTLQSSKERRGCALNNFKACQNKSMINN